MKRRHETMIIKDKKARYNKKQQHMQERGQERETAAGKKNRTCTLGVCSVRLVDAVGELEDGIAALPALLALDNRLPKAVDGKHRNAGLAPLSYPLPADTVTSQSADRPSAWVGRSVLWDVTVSARGG